MDKSVSRAELGGPPAVFSPHGFSLTAWTFLPARSASYASTPAKKEL